VSTASADACLVNRIANKGLGPTWARKFKRSSRRVRTMFFRRGRHVRRLRHKLWAQATRLGIVNG
jgi:hypothetical protein